MSNIKIDIIYYKTASDFEMEFNLSGCCRMRMFKDKVETPKSLVSTLARDVARSKIILIVTDLFGENEGVTTISKAIRFPLVTLDKKEFGIETSEEIMVPQSAVALVTKAGIFGGCLIENGPQSIIIVSSNRDIRHEIMKAYVHNYVFDVAQLLAYQERMGSTAVIPNGYKHIEPPITENETQEIVSDSSEEKQTDISSNTTSNFTVVAADEPIIDFDTFPDTDNIVPKKKRRKGRGSNITLLVIVILLLIGFGILAYYFVYLPLLGKPSVFSEGSGNVVTEFLNGLFS